MTTVLEDVQSAVNRNRQAVAIGGENPLTYAELWDEVGRFAGALRDREIGTDQPVVVAVSDPRLALVAIYGSLRNGNCPVTVPQAYSNAELCAVLAETGAPVAVLAGRSPMPISADADSLQTIVTAESAMLGRTFEEFVDTSGFVRSTRTGVAMKPRADDDPGLVAYTRRQDDDLVGIVYTHAALRASAIIGQTLVTESVGGHLASLPLSNPIELCYGATATMFDGGTYHPVEEWEPASIAGRFHHDIDRTICPPERYETLSTIDGMAEQSGVAVLEPTAAAVADASNGPMTLYGTPETGITHVTRVDADGDREPTTLPTVDTRLGHDGELVVRGPGTMAKYYDRPELTAERIVSVGDTAWIRTGIRQRIGGESPESTVGITASD